ncbi:TlyA family RNA methyltransferase [Campylobacter vulpis]|uniref:Hemolysin n=2 Tax=Campylobacter vulpis TaxID=1655500 RepID=A0A2G4R1B7_9BACT|nr:TlyA family RNA methyltransferase [Campylobacter vulpis]MBS4240893.1 TlyA family RNA methyltransferase [Campylobacter vulpis]MBS4252312.1 TlyA family RNA methyltransferase [Campylobacter vulpis]MBS4281538.1 TlyA family RNA methyltransferase [Campylobacter vulpis]MBS4307034.1 TlyA family RNA methyltransferase [Campylobacter vulpis]MBS4313778.1 TlyA family RNA methyltransferase [Campylobacter vulpis]
MLWLRYDLFVAKRLKISRNKALELIQNQKVALNGNFLKPSFVLDETDEELNLELLSEIYVSRAAIKLRDFLEKLPLQLEGLECLDIGSSTGGFVQILLENGVKSVVALDVGKNQLHQNLRQDIRVKSLENMDLREFKSDVKFDLITCDVSFISLLNLLSYIDNLAKRDIVLLFKPQFEVGKEAKRDKKGVLKDEKSLKKARINFEKACFSYAWILEKCELSSLKGKEGNDEFFYHFRKK